MFDVIAFDADDTLWHTERLYVDAQNKFVQLLAAYHPADWVNQRLSQTEARNIEHFGYGIKSFALSMIETAVELTEGRISGQDIQVIVDLAKTMLNATVELLPYVKATIPVLAARYRLMVVSKGDLLDQETKITRSGLVDYFQAVVIVSEKDRQSYQRLLKRHSIELGCFLMVGNSLRSDILPVLELGGTAVYIPYETEWLHEAGTLPPQGQPGYYTIEHIGQLPALLERLQDREGDRQLITRIE
ncbi:MAG: HAD family hydrolase [Anaerolineaceae bacterium]|jgi:putative hydrolase of the HAD superfamily